MAEIKSIFQQSVQSHLAAFEKSFTASKIEVLEKISREILRCFKAGNKILICGNGGSAADSQHIAAEFIGRFNRERQALPAIALTTDTSCLTALANDYNYSMVFSRQVEGIGRKGDVLIGISTSGNSANVLEAVKQAKKQEIATIGFTGMGGGNLSSLVDICFHAESKKTPHVQEVHIAALHAISEVVEEVLFGS